MKSTLIAAFCATSVLATPLVQRDYEFKWDFSTVTKTVVEGAQETGGRHLIGDWQDWRKIAGDESSSSAAPAETSSAPVAAAVVPVQPAYSHTQQQQEHSHEVTVATATAEASTAAASAAPSKAPSMSNLGGYAGPIMDAHNSHRANHSVPDLVWSDSLASIAAEIASSCVYAHNTKAGGGGYGQNIGAGTKPEDVNGMITNAMYNGEINDYPLPYGREPDMSNFEKWGHYSQIVWKSTTSVGCATQYCPGGLTNANGGGISPYFTVCNYSPPGNFGGQYAANVLKPNGSPTVTV